MSESPGWDAKGGKGTDRAIIYFLFQVCHPWFSTLRAPTAVSSVCCTSSMVFMPLVSTDWVPPAGNFRAVVSEVRILIPMASSHEVASSWLHPGPETTTLSRQPALHDSPHAYCCSLHPHPSWPLGPTVLRWLTPAQILHYRTPAHTFVIKPSQNILT